MQPCHRLLILFLSLTLLWGCHKKGSITSRPLVVANSAEPASLDLHIVTGQPELRVVGAIFEGLVLRGLHGTEVRPGAARTWEISMDGKFYTFHLRPLTWSNGQPLTARDFLRSWRRFINPSTASEYSSLLKIIRNGTLVREKTLPVDSLGVFAPDDSTFQVALENPVAFFLDLCAFEPFFPVPIDTIDKYQEKWTDPAHITSNGPFLLKSWQRNVALEVVKNPSYWDAANVHQERIIFKPVEDQLTGYNMFLAKEVDWIFSIPPSKLEAAKKMPEFFNPTLFGTYFYIINCKNPGYDSKELRKALSYAINRKKIVARVQKDIYRPATSFVPPTASYPELGLELYDPAKAKECLAKSGYGPGKPPPHLQILFNTAESHRDNAEVVRQMWKENLGLDAEVVNYEWKVYLQNTKNLDYPSVARASWIGDFPDPISFLELYTSDNANNRTGYANPVYDEGIKASWKISDPKQRLDKLRECEKILMEDMPIIPIYYYALTELRSPAIQNAIPNSLGMYSWKDVYLAP